VRIRTKPATWLASGLGGAGALALAGYVAVRASPWPSALLFRIPFNRQARLVSRALAAHVPANVSAQVNERYHPRGRHTYLDVFHPADLAPGQALPTVVWVHGGAWVSGNRRLVANYLRVLAGHGFTTVGVGYTIAPAGRYPLPLRQLNTALDHLRRHASRLHVDPGRIVLAGDSSGAQIAAQVANAASEPGYADVVGIRPTIDSSQVVATLLYCGAYDLNLVDLNGDWGWFLRTILWAYTGRKDVESDPRLDSASVARYVTGEFPPAFIGVGNADPLVEQSRSLATALGRAGAPVETLIFPDDTTPAVEHEFQFDLDSAAGQLALRRSVAFLRRHTGG
jgi:acetyl esterase